MRESGSGSEVWCLHPLVCGYSDMGWKGSMLNGSSEMRFLFPFLLKLPLQYIRLQRVIIKDAALVLFPVVRMKFQCESFSRTKEINMS